MPTAVLQTDSLNAPTLAESASGTRGRRVYRVDTTDELAVLTATDLPAIDDAWDDDDFPSLVVVQRDVRYEQGNYHLVYVTYETPGAAGRLEPRPAPNVAFTKRTYSEQTVNVKFGITGATNHALTLPIAGGDGAPKTVIGTRLVVTVWRAVGDYDSAEDLAWEELHGGIVEDALALPPLAGTAADMEYAEEKLLFLYHEASGEAGLVRLDFYFEAKSDHHVHWLSENDKGESVGSEKVTQIYPLIAFPSGVW